jgi:diguanylate cyclase (GGDEF)-like protein/hemerythrin-like metal-binding protein
VNSGIINTGQERKKGMYQDKSNEKKPALYRQLVLKSIIVSVIILVLIFIKQYIIQVQIHHEEQIADMLNTSGRQRMLSQKIAKDVLVIARRYGSSDVSYIVNDLEITLGIWEEKQQSLLQQTTENKLIGKQSIIWKLFDNCEPYMEQVIKASKDIIQAIKEDSFDQEFADGKLRLLSKNEKLFLENMELIVAEYDIETQKAIEIVKKSEVILLALIFIMIFVLISLVVVPAVKALGQAYQEADESGVNLMTLFWSMKGGQLFLDGDGTITLYNSDAEKYLSPSNRSDKSYHILESIRGCSIDIMQLIEKLDIGDSVADIEGEIEDREGNIRTIIMTAVATSYHKGKSILLGIYDITERKQMEEALKLLASKDKLTGLYNRTYLEMIINDEVARSERYEIPLSVCIIDLDHFKNINDRWGHPVGDTVLKMTADIITKNIRMSDYAIRIGGEEFVILLPHTDLDGAFIVAEKIRLLIENSIHPVVGKYTASFGVAERHRGETYRLLYNRMDKALYEAKEGGRNRVVKSMEPGERFEALSFSWKEKWNCGEKGIDEQHRELFHTISRLVSNSYSMEDTTMAIEQIDSVTKELRDHFEYEEKILKEVGYEDHLRHKSIHLRLLELIEQTKRDLVEGDMVVSTAFLFLFDYVIIGHVLKEDVKFFSSVEKSFLI